MKARYCSASARIEIRCRSTFWRRASSAAGRAALRSRRHRRPAPARRAAGSASCRRSVEALTRSSRAPRQVAGDSAASSSLARVPRRSNGSGAGGSRERRPRRAAARSPASGGAASATARHLVEPAVAVQHHVAAGREAPLRRARRALPRQRLHREIVAHEQPVEADRAAHDHSRSPAAKSWPARSRIDVRVDDMRRHRQRQVRQRPERREVGRLSSARGASTTGSSRWLSRAARPCPGMCLITGSTPPASRPSATAPAERRDLVRLAAVGAVADHVVRARHRHVEHRQAVDVMPTPRRSCAISRAPSRGQLAARLAVARRGAVP